jgi:DNA polymerase-3 subunit epsilon
MAVERACDDPATPLWAVTFCVVDTETTGTSPTHDGITEIGAVKVRGGERLGTFQTVVDPSALDGILATFVEFAAGSVLVGHNLRFDVAFLDAALVRAGWPRLAHPKLDTCALARRLVRDEVPDCRLSTLTARFGLDHRATHRALDDALAACDLLHHLIERSAGFGVVGLDDLLALHREARHRHATKLRLTGALPRTAGVYVFLDGRGTVLFVGTAANLRGHVRSMFAVADRRTIGPLLRETGAIRYVACASMDEAADRAVALVRRHQPRYNRVGRRSRL